MDFLRAGLILEGGGHRGVYTIQPNVDMNVGRITRDKDKLYALYDLGYEDASNLFPDLIDYLDK